MGLSVASPPEHRAANLSWLFAQAAHVLNTQLTAALEDVGISPRAYCVLTQAMSGEYTQIELATASGIDKTTMVVMLDDLEAKGLAQRLPDPRDRRARVISVTKAGVNKVHEAVAIVDGIHDAALASLPETQREALLDGLTWLVENDLSTPSMCTQSVRRPRG